MFVAHIKKAGYLASACSLFEAYHSLGCKQTERYPRNEYIYVPIGVRDGKPSAHLRERHIPTRSIHPAMFLTTNSIVVVSNSQKQSVSDAIPNVVLPSFHHIAHAKSTQCELANAKLLNIFYWHIRITPKIEVKRQMAHYLRILIYRLTFSFTITLVIYKD